MQHVAVINPVFNSLMLLAWLCPTQKGTASLTIYTVPQIGNRCWRHGRAGTHSRSHHLSAAMYGCMWM